MSHPHELLLSKNGIAVTDLSEKTQKKIAKFAIETDDDKRDALDETITGEVEDFLEDKAAKEKAAKKKESHAALKKEATDKKKIDVSTAPTAATATATAEPKKERTAFDVVYGRK